MRISTIKDSLSKTFLEVLLMKIPKNQHQEMREPRTEDPEGRPRF